MQRSISTEEFKSMGIAEKSKLYNYHNDLYKDLLRQCREEEAEMWTKHEHPHGYIETWEPPRKKHGMDILLLGLAAGWLIFLAIDLIMH